MLKASFFSLFFHSNFILQKLHFKQEFSDCHMAQKSETSHVASMGFLGLEALLPGGPSVDSKTDITCNDGTRVSGLGNNDRESQAIASEKAAEHDRSTTGNKTGWW